MRIVCSVSLISLAVLVVSGCASTHFQVTGQTAQQPLCQPPGEQASALVFWGPKWRPDQKGGPAPRGLCTSAGLRRFGAATPMISKPSGMAVSMAPMSRGTVCKRENASLDQTDGLNRKAQGQEEDPPHHEEPALFGHHGLNAGEQCGKLVFR